MGPSLVLPGRCHGNPQRRPRPQRKEVRPLAFGAEHHGFWAGPQGGGRGCPSQAIRGSRPGPSRRHGLKAQFSLLPSSGRPHPRMASRGVFHRPSRGHPSPSPAAEPLWERVWGRAAGRCWESQSRPDCRICESEICTSLCPACFPWFPAKQEAGVSRLPTSMSENTPIAPVRAPGPRACSTRA